MGGQKRKPVRLDGTTLEGGGQILRLALAISSLTDIPIHLYNIRGNRGTKPQHGGIRQAHLGGAAWLTNACEAATEGLAVRSKDLLFEPGLGTNADIKDAMKAVEQDGVLIGQVSRRPQPNTKSSKVPSIWNDILDNGKVVRRETSIALSTPGSAFGVLQALLPFILFRSQPSKDLCDVSLRITVDGGTNVWHSMSYEWAEHVLFPMLHSKLGIGPIQMELHKRSWSTGSKSIGSVTFTIPPLNPSVPIPAFAFTNRGAVEKVSIFVFAPNAAWQTAIMDATQSVLEQRFPDIQQEVVTNAASGHPVRLYLLLVAHTEHGYRLGRDRLYEEKPTADKMDRIALKMAQKVTEDLRAEVAHGGCVDEYLQDQLVVFQALAAGKTVVERDAEPSLHTRTARWVAETILGIEFGEDGSCDGIAYAATAEAKV